MLIVLTAMPERDLGALTKARNLVLRRWLRPRPATTDRTDAKASDSSPPAAVEAIELDGDIGGVALRVRDLRVCIGDAVIVDDVSSTSTRARRSLCSGRTAPGSRPC